jgi:hypothetical protein
MFKYDHVVITTYQYSMYATLIWFYVLLVISAYAWIIYITSTWKPYLTNKQRDAYKNMLFFIDYLCGKDNYSSLSSLHDIFATSLSTRQFHVILDV